MGLGFRFRIKGLELGPPLGGLNYREYVFGRVKVTMHIFDLIMAIGIYCPYYRQSVFCCTY